MYDGCFGLNRRPFTAVPQIDHYFPAATIENARTALARSIQRGEGAGLVVGPSGTGKTLLCMMLAEQFRRSFDVVLLAGGGLNTRRALFQAILYELGQPYRGLDEGEARLAVVDHLMGDEDQSHGVVMLVDEAHTLPMRLLDEIRLLTNLIRDGQPLVRLVLAGGPALEERFANPKLDSFSQRLSARCYIEALNRTETEEYILAQIEAAGGRGEQLFPTETCNRVYQATGGVPRLINQVCDHALVLTYVAGRQKVEPEGIEEAWGDLQQLPTPWSGESKHEHAGAGVIEFGALEDQFESSAAPAKATFRISSADESEEADGAPGEQIHRIEQLLAEADEEFQPAGSIGPEVELQFDDVPHPFEEEYEHEEIVADRYSTVKLAPAAAVSRPVIVAMQEEEEVEMPEEFEASASYETPSFETPEPAAVAFAEPTDFEKMEYVADAELAPLVVAVAENQPAASGEARGESFKSPKSPIDRTPTGREYRHLFAKLRKG